MNKKDRDFIGYAKPFDYPHKIHFSNKHIMGNFNPRTYSIEDTTNIPNFNGLGDMQDFSERADNYTNDLRNYSMSTDFGNLGSTGALISPTQRNIMIVVGLAFIGFLAWTSIKNESKKRYQESLY
jgi:hypothetical protein